MKIFVPFSWSSPMLLSTIVITAVIIIVIITTILLLYKAKALLRYKNKMWIVCGTLFASLICAICLCPQQLVIDSEDIVICLNCGKITLHRSEILKIEHYPNGIESSRRVGISKFYGDIGYFTSTQCGNYLSFVTNPKDVCVIYRQNKQPIVVSVDNPFVLDGMIEMDDN